MLRHSIPGMPGIRCLFSPPDGSEGPIEDSIDLGRMLLDIHYEPGDSGRGRPVFFDARLERGILRVPDVPADGLG